MRPVWTLVLEAIEQSDNAVGSFAMCRAFAKSLVGFMFIWPLAVVAGLQDLQCIITSITMTISK